MIPLYYAYVAFSNLSMVSTVMGLYLSQELILLTLPTPSGVDTTLYQNDLSSKEVLS